MTNSNIYQLDLEYSSIEDTLINKPSPNNFSSKILEPELLELSTHITLDCNHYFLSSASKKGGIDKGYIRGFLNNNDGFTEISLLLAEPLHNSYKIFWAKKEYNEKYGGQYNGIWTYDSNIGYDSKDTILIIPKILKSNRRIVAECKFNLKPN